MAPAEILAMAESLLDRARPETAGLWPRAAALLTRQALESALDEFWREKKLALDRCGTRPQLVCLREYLPDRMAAGAIAHAWSALTAACHHHPYELAPVAGELRRLLDVVRAFAAKAGKNS